MLKTHTPICISNEAPLVNNSLAAVALCVLLTQMARAVSFVLMVQIDKSDHWRPRRCLHLAKDAICFTFSLCRWRVSALLLWKGNALVNHSTRGVSEIMNHRLTLMYYEKLTDIFCSNAIYCWKIVNLNIFKGCKKVTKTLDFFLQFPQSRWQYAYQFFCLMTFSLNWDRGFNLNVRIL